MSINNFTFTNSDEKHKLVVNVDKFGRQEASFHYIDYFTNKQYSCVCGFDDPAFRDVPKRFIKDALENLIANKQYVVRVRNESEIICVFTFECFKKDANIAVELSIKQFEEDKMVTQLQSLVSDMNNVYLSNVIDLSAIINAGISDFYRKYHEFLMKHCNQYRLEYEPTNHNSHEIFIKRRLLDHTTYTYGDRDHAHKIFPYTCNRNTCGKDSCICIPDGFYCDSNYSKNYCVHASSPESPHLLATTKECKYNGDCYPYYNNLLMTFLSISGYNIWFGSKCNIVFAKTSHKLFYCGIGMQGFKYSDFKILNVPGHQHVVMVISNIE